MTQLDTSGEATLPSMLDREAIVRSLSFFAVLFGLLLLPILAHGCHRDDIDLEPSAPPREIRP